ncbi:MAG: hypothetical protein PHV34_08875 [Verrucomicrobiae bacterium]|nr:hypothetical protein [Verrucomicrobiae bacterium]
MKTKNHPKKQSSNKSKARAKSAAKTPVESPVAPKADSAGTATDKPAAAPEKAREIAVDGDACKLQRQLAAFIQRRCEGSSVGAVGKEIGVSHTTMFYLLRGQGNIRLRLLEQIVDRLKVGLKDVFPGQ